MLSVMGLKRGVVMFAGLLMVLGLGACSTPSLNGLATPETTVKDPGLLGMWRDADEKDKVYVVTEDENDSYRVTMAGKGEDGPVTFVMTLVDLGPSRFADLTVTAAQAKEMFSKHGRMVQPMHIFMRIARTDDTVKLHQLDEKWLTEGLEKGTLKLAYVKVTRDGDTSNVLSASTAELQAFFKEHAGTKAAWDKAVELTRVR